MNRTERIEQYKGSRDSLTMDVMEAIGDMDSIMYQELVKAIEARDTPQIGGLIHAGLWALEQESAA